MELPIDHRLFLLLSAPFVGSFLGVVIERYPTGRPLLMGRSVCSHCEHALGAADLVPLVSWLARRARCR
jgi:leader peptidase (prepilin peptidase)/N-methyltransferase